MVRAIITVILDDGGPMDVEHMEVVAKVKTERWTLDQVNEALRKCKRPARAYSGFHRDYPQ